MEVLDMDRLFQWLHKVREDFTASTTEGIQYSQHPWFQLGELVS